ncbi:hypothetical protein QBC43DRAFT_325725 [Cladorrhinum sp. PSN259]|nr:hypothetical protein QBC43DRAFT_325725 [Cladorrhinum sp. PSN259]
MSNMFRSRAGPLLIASGIFGGLLYSTVGGKNQPRPRATNEPGSTLPISETLQSIGSQGGTHARKPMEDFPGSGRDINRNTRYQSHREDDEQPHAKRSESRTVDLGLKNPHSYGSRKNV